jgi:hypothetical protein
MQTIETSFNRFGAKNTLVRRVGNVTLFSLAYPGVKKPIGYDVAVVRVGMPSVFLKKPEEFEYLPGPEEWGKKAWSFTTIEAATKKFDEVAEHYDHKK